MLRLNTTWQALPAALAAAPRDVSLRGLAALLQRVSGQVYRPRFTALERLHLQIAEGNLGGGATLSGCRIGPAPAAERVLASRPSKSPRKSLGKVPFSIPAKVDRGAQTP